MKLYYAHRKDADETTVKDDAAIVALKFAAGGERVTVMSGKEFFEKLQFDPNLGSMWKQAPGLIVAQFDGILIPDARIGKFTADLITAMLEAGGKQVLYWRRADDTLFDVEGVNTHPDRQGKVSWKDGYSPCLPGGEDP